MQENNPQAAQMADESMVRTLAAQAEAIWPQERPLLARYGLGEWSRVLDAGCGTGEFSLRVAQDWPGAEVAGLDLLPGPLAIARARAAGHGLALRFEQGDLFELPYAAASFDLVACRHVLQAVPRPEAAIAELLRVVKPGGWLHLLVEDYAMLHMTPGALDPDLFWREGPIEFTARTGTDARIGRRAWSILAALGVQDLHVDYAIVDTLRVPREVFAAIITAWRDGYAEALVEGSARTSAWIHAQFEQVIASIRDPAQYAVWMVPIVSGRHGSGARAPAPAHASR
jgi:ubiquinone/menaquinone biosynthesis C-methylase UbiE